ncbi:putative membrane protein DUF2232 [Caldicellulosiruptor bescii]|nr:DUF2232 domain-containing protein [Caldicellulosiruptor bescii]PBC87408.1 putative membrane protein DUF2232 [Caldicellulosiruptor bescii]PBC90348.1 putative membrane protein DUF2232 [Caldicellulosiruptor bescii]PBD04226.1 putative membrane protein DUF2232 [Caldicellulosiruptor bescii]PBD06145.1 putative membrane protein DUF2232 [Caldicellulosiruptor bescii]PBD08855.1 putative membrane protein DUF2232 [Caldicellulosiruptor bescii]
MNNKLLKEGLISIVTGVFQMVLFLLQFNPIFALVGFPLYVVAAKENFLKKMAISYVISALIIMILGKSPINLLFILITFILPVCVFLILRVSKTTVMDFVIYIAGFLFYHVLFIKAIKILYKIDIIELVLSILEGILKGYFNPAGDDKLNKLVEFLKLLMPGFVIVEAITFALFGYYITKFVANMVGIQKEFLPFSKLFMPKEVTVGVVVFFILSLFLTSINVLYIIVSNMTIILSWLLFIQALSLMYAVITEKIRSPFIGGWLFAVLIMFSMHFLIFFLMMFIGFLDLIVDFKKRKPKRVEL